MKTNNKLLNNFLLNLKSRGKSPNTIKGYENDLVQMIKYTSKQNNINELDSEFFNKVTYQDLEYYVNYLTEIGNSPSTRSRKISSLKEFFKYLTDKIKIIKENPSIELELPKIPVRQPKFLNVKESRDMVNLIDGRNYERDKAITTLFLNLGLRVSELTSLNIDNIKDGYIKFIRKGNEEKILYLNDKCIKALNQYLNIRNSYLTKGDNNALFLSERGNRIHPNTIRYMTDKYGSINPHGIRHSCFTNLLNTGKVNIRQIQELANHKNLTTTSRYTHITSEQIRNAINLNPY